MNIICSDTPVPSFDSLYSKIVPYMSLPDFRPTIPPLPALPNPVMPDINCNNYSMVQLAQQLQSYQCMLTFNSVFRPITSFLGLSLDAILPKIPGTSINLLNLLSLNPEELYKQISLVLPNFRFPQVPDPMFRQLNVPNIQLNITVKMAINGYMSSFFNIIQSLIGKITKKLKLPGMPALPEIPALSTVIGAINSNLPGFSSVLDLLDKVPDFNIGLLMSKISISPFPSLPVFPSPLVKQINMPEVEFNELLVIMFANFNNFNLSVVVNFCSKVLSRLGFSFPTICIPI